ncbi:hypothetical protein UFOVP222_26 [uncultured Caudovirales phage]|uniref:Major tropism determinant N-terminal domain-containing protein n=1 Tax=uncultured Caudovirales phage TaxID=2100421 RepID=A0A6J7WV43_9CAUD|nr:hypothetical protein UFOVP108_21 [uncultured Caudovirales phage]CAB5219113.1 hypothetical protein UFOVP222_26 [uncultured Caudovirales phage]
MTTTSIQLKRGLASAWVSNNPVLLAGEAGFEIDTNKMKVGNGIDAWNDLPYVNDYLATEGNNDNTLSGIESLTTIDSFPVSSWRSMSYKISLSSATTGGYSSINLDILIDGSGVSINQYSALDNNGDVGTINVSSDGTTVLIKAAPLSPTQPITVRFYRTGLKA